MALTDDQIAYKVNEIRAGYSYKFPLEVVDAFLEEYPMRAFVGKLYDNVATVIGKQNTEFLYQAQLQNDKDRGKRNFAIATHADNLSGSMAYSSGAFTSYFYRSLHDSAGFVGRQQVTKFEPEDIATHTRSKEARFNEVMRELGDNMRKRFPQPFYIKE